MFVGYFTDEAATGFVLKIAHANSLTKKLIHMRLLNAPQQARPRKDSRFPGYDLHTLRICDLPADVQRTDFEHIHCPNCGKDFVSAQKKR